VEGKTVKERRETPNGKEEGEEMKENE